MIALSSFAAVSGHPQCSTLQHITVAGLLQGNNEGSATMDLDAERQAHALEELLVLESNRARTWRYGWTVVNGLSTLAPLAIMPFVQRAIWPDLAAGSVTSAVSTGFTIFWPLQVEHVEVQLRSISGLTPCERLFRLQMLTISAAEDEVARRAWPWHAVNFGISAALGMVLAFGFGHRTGGFITGLSGFIAGEAQLFTQPENLHNLQLPVASSRVRPVLSGLEFRNLVTVGAAFEFQLW
jgi:hypothetical protein